jgi:hypothetical protein
VRNNWLVNGEIDIVEEVNFQSVAKTAHHSTKRVVPWITFRLWNTSYSVINALYSGALVWIAGKSIPDVEELKLSDSPLDKLVQKAYVEQTSLGWNLIFRGFWTTSWRSAQDYYFSHNAHLTGHKNNGARWASQVQGRVYDLFNLFGVCEMKLRKERTLRHSG